MILPMFGAEKLQAPRIRRSGEMNVHPFRVIHWIETHCKMDTVDGLLPEDLELELWNLYINEGLLPDRPISERLAGYLALMRLCEGDGDG
jgi:hypothetical protein